MKNACITSNKSRITTKCGTKVAHGKPILHAKENSEIFTDVRDNDVIVLKFEHFCQKTLNFEKLYLGSLWMKLCKVGRVNCCFHFYSQNLKKVFLKMSF